MPRLKEKGIAQILLIFILLAGIGAGVFLIQSQGNFFTQLFPKTAPGQTIAIVDDSGNPITTTTSPTVKVKLTSPEWSSQSTVSSVVKEPTSAINYSSNSGYLNWQNPNGVLTDDSTYANVPNLGVGKVSNVLVAGGFGFSIPTDASISGVLVEVKRGSQNGTGVVDKDLRIGVGRRLLSPNNKAKADIWPNTESYISYGGQNDLWGLSLTSTEVNDPNFGVAMQAGYADTGTGTDRAAVNHIKMTVYYTLSPAAVKTDTATLAEDPNFSVNAQTLTFTDMVSYTFSDSSDGLKTLYGKFTASDGQVQNANPFPATVELLAPTPTPKSTPTPLPSPIPITDNYEVGIEAGTQFDTGKVNLVAGSGAKWVRLNFILRDEWAGVDDPQFTNTYNQIINEYLIRGINVIGLIGAESVKGGYDRTNPAAFTDKFVTAADSIIGNFGDRVKAYELFNEPNDWAGGTSAQVPASNFADYLEEVYRQIKIVRGRSDIRLMSGPLFSHDLDTAAGYLDQVYISGKSGGWEQIKQQTGSYPLDGVGYHIYVAQGMADEEMVESKMNGNLKALVGVINQYDPGKKIWITEFGWGTGSGRVTEGVQASNLNKAYAVLKSNGNVKLAMWFALMDFDPTQWGLIHADGVKKQAWTNFIAMNGMCSSEPLPDGCSCTADSQCSSTNCCGGPTCWVRWVCAP